jgi:hypothetical protein
MRSINRYPTRRLLILLVGFLLTFFAGCYTTVLVDPLSIRSDTTKDIVIATRSGEKISFEGGSYSFASDSSGRMFIKGEGRSQHRIASQDEPFSGTVSGDDIVSVQTYEKSTLFYFSVIAGAVVTVGWVVFLLTFGRMGNVG